ncbi:hypothetical protein HDU99_000838 [Rhizoclosmatium hyalinum]|nr:hypothetical protein HDU99_000838 [Rhizoclosmatium hyalinum]
MQSVSWATVAAGPNLSQQKTSLSPTLAKKILVAKSAQITLTINSLAPCLTPLQVEYIRTTTAVPSEHKEPWFYTTAVRDPLCAKLLASMSSEKGTTAAKFCTSLTDSSLAGWSCSTMEGHGYLWVGGDGLSMDLYFVDEAKTVAAHDALEAMRIQPVILFDIDHTFAIPVEQCGEASSYDTCRLLHVGSGYGSVVLATDAVKHLVSLSEEFELKVISNSAQGRIDAVIRAINLKAGVVVFSSGFATIGRYHDLKRKYGELHQPRSKSAAMIFRVIPQNYFAVDDKPQAWDKKTAEQNLIFVPASPLPWDSSIEAVIPRALFCLQQYRKHGISFSQSLGDYGRQLV